MPSKKEFIIYVIFAVVAAIASYLTFMFGMIWLVSEAAPDDVLVDHEEVYMSVDFYGGEIYEYRIYTEDEEYHYYVSRAEYAEDIDLLSDLNPNTPITLTIYHTYQPVDEFDNPLGDYQVASVCGVATEDQVYLDCDVYLDSIQASIRVLIIGTGISGAILLGSITTIIIVAVSAKKRKKE